MTSYINVKNKQGITKLTSLIKEAGFNDVKVTVGANTITLTPSPSVDLSAGLADLTSHNYKSFKSVGEGIKFLADRTKKAGKSVSHKK